MDPEFATERELVERSRRGDRVAFSELVRMHESAVYGFLRARLGQTSDADDLAQEAFFRAYQGLGRFDTAQIVRPWLLGIARNLLREHARRTKRRKEVAWTGLCLEIESGTEDTNDRFDDALEHLPVCVSNLGASAREALSLHYAGRMRLAKIGEHLRRSEGAVKLLMFRARRAIKRCLLGKLGRSRDETV